MTDADFIRYLSGLVVAADVSYAYGMTEQGDEIAAMVADSFAETADPMAILAAVETETGIDLANFDYFGQAAA